MEKSETKNRQLIQKLLVTAYGAAFVLFLIASPVSVRADHTVVWNTYCYFIGNETGGCSNILSQCEAAQKGVLGVTQLCTSVGGSVSQLSHDVDASTSDGFTQIEDLINEAGGIAVIENLLNTAGVSTIADVITTASGGALGQVLNQVGVSDITGVLSQATGIDFGSLLNQVGISDITGVLSQATGIDFGNVFDFFGSSGIGSIIDEAGSFLFGSSLDAAGASGVISAITSAGGLDAALGGAGGGLTSILGGLASSVFGGGSGCGYSGTPGSVGSPFPGSAIALALGLHVPVKDFEAEAYLQTIMANSFITTVNTSIIAAHTDAAREYLRLLCFKEYVLDPQLHNDWARVIGQFVKTTADWVLNAYNNNPIFITSPVIYYQLVDDEIFETYVAEIKGSAIGKNAQKELIKSLEKRRFETAFPNTGGQEWVPDDLAQVLSDDFYANGGWAKFTELAVDPSQSIQNLVPHYEAELDRRRKRGREIEEDKLNWGQGFFSNEVCDLEIYTWHLEDRRNCRIVTPGSLIREQVSWVFSTAIRQMEAADEFEEWIAPNTVTILNDILNNTGLDNFVEGSKFSTRINETVAPASASAIAPLIESGARRGAYPVEFQTDVSDFNKFKYLPE